MAHIKIKRGLYWHHGVQLSDGTVVHYTGRGGEKTKTKKNALIQQTGMDKFVRDNPNPVVVVQHEKCFPTKLIEERARWCIGEDDYDLIQNNCEHFAVWCVTGKDESKQVERAFKKASTGGKMVLASSVLFAGIKAAQVAKGLMGQRNSS